MTVDSPAEATTIVPGESFDVRVTATDDSAVRQVMLRWIAPTTEVVYALEPEGGGAFTLQLDLSWSAPAGPRTLRVTATDDAGNKTTAPDRTIQVVR